MVMGVSATNKSVGYSQLCLTNLNVFKSVLTKTRQQPHTYVVYGDSI